MLKTILLIAILCLAIAAGPLLSDSQGLVHIAAGGYVIETSLVTACILLFAAAIIVYLVAALLRRLLRLPSGTIGLLSRHSSRKALKLQTAAHLAYEEGRFDKALELFKKSGPIGSLPLPCQFTAARCAFALGRLEDTRNYLEAMSKDNQQTVLACNVLRAKLNLHIGNSKAALECLNQVKNLQLSPEVTKLYYQCYKQEGDYAKVKAVMPAMLKHKLITPAEAAADCRDFVSWKLQTVPKAGRGQELRTLAKQERRNDLMMCAILTELVKDGEETLATKLTLEQLRHSPGTELYESIASWAYGMPEVLKELLGMAKEKKHAENPALQRALANLEYRGGDLNGARKRLEQLIAEEPSPELYTQLASMLSQERLYDQAAGCYQLALKP